MRTLLHPAAKSPILTDIVLLVARVAIGIILVAHGWQKFNEWTLDGTSAAFEGMGIPAPAVSAAFVTIVEIIGGVLLIIGLLTPIAAVLNIVSTLGALFLVHISNGVFVGDGGFELVLALFAGLLIIAALGGGKLSVDGLLGRKTVAEKETVPVA